MLILHQTAGNKYWQLDIMIQEDNTCGFKLRLKIIREGSRLWVYSLAFSQANEDFHLFGVDKLGLASAAG